MMNTTTSMMIPNLSSKYDPNVIIQAANASLGLENSGTTSTTSSNVNSNTIARGQMIFQQALMDWTDDARECDDDDDDNKHSNDCGSGTSRGSLREILHEALPTLWIAYAQFLADAKQYKSSFEAYEQAIKELPFHSSRIYLEYARFAEERHKLKLAQDVYIRALVRGPENGDGGSTDDEHNDNNDENNSNNNNSNQSHNTNSNTNSNSIGAIHDENDRQLLWNEFLQMMQNNTNNPNLTLNDLQQAVFEKEAERRKATSFSKKNSLDAGSDGGGAETTRDHSDPMSMEDIGGGEDNQQDDEPFTKRRKKSMDDTNDSGSSDVDELGFSTTYNNTNNLKVNHTKIEGESNQQRMITKTTTSNNPSSKKMGGSSASSGSKTHVVLTESIELEGNKLLRELLTSTTADKSKGIVPNSILSNSSNNRTGAAALPPDLVAAWMSYDGNETPQMTPSMFLFQSTTPKLSDPTAKDILGLDLSIQLIQRLLQPVYGNLVLQVCSGLWSLQALCHQEMTEELEFLDRIMMSEHEQLESVLASRLSGTTNGAAALRAAVEQMNASERNTFRMNCSSKRLFVLQTMTWECRRVLYIQQSILGHLQLPIFADGPTIDPSTLYVQQQICKYLHSAFYIRDRMGIDPHESMLRSQLKRLLEQEQQQQRQQPAPISTVPQSSDAITVNATGPSTAGVMQKLLKTTPIIMSSAPKTNKRATTSVPAVGGITRAQSPVPASQSASSFATSVVLPVLTAPPGVGGSYHHHSKISVMDTSQQQPTQYILPSGLPMPPPPPPPQQQHFMPPPGQQPSMMYQQQQLQPQQQQQQQHQQQYYFATQQQQQQQLMMNINAPQHLKPPNALVHHGGSNHIMMQQQLPPVQPTYVGGGLPPPMSQPQQPTAASYVLPLGYPQQQVPPASLQQQQLQGQQQQQQQQQQYPFYNSQ